MKCHEARKWTSPYLDSELGQTKTYEISEHLQQCEACAKRFEGEGRVDEMIRDRIEPERMPDEVWASLRGIPDSPQRTGWHAWGSRLALAAVLTTSRMGRPLAMPPLVSASRVMTRISTKKIVNRLPCRVTVTVLISPSSNRLVARKTMATYR